ncbi:MAG: hypothetical protein ACOYXS_05735 [Chloroflexota bacterium]
MGVRFAAFLSSVLGAGVELFGAIYGQGVLGHGMLFGAAGPGTISEGTILGFALATLTLVGGVLLMFVRETRALAAIIAASALAGTLAAGLLFGAGALLVLLGAVLAVRVDRSAPLY